VIVLVGMFLLGRWLEKKEQERRRIEAPPPSVPVLPPLPLPPPPPPSPRLYLYIMRGVPGSGKSYIAQQPRVFT